MCYSDTGIVLQYSFYFSYLIIILLYLQKQQLFSELYSQKHTQLFIPSCSYRMCLFILTLIFDHTCPYMTNFQIFSGCLQIRSGMAERHWMGSYWFTGSWESQESWRNPQWQEVPATCRQNQIYQRHRFLAHGLSQAKCRDHEQGEAGIAS